MITEDKVTEIFCIADGFCKEFEADMAKNVLPSTKDAPKRRRKRLMSDAEVITILICFHFNTYRNFKHYYLSVVCGQWRHLFPMRFSYNRFVEVMPRYFVALTMFLKHTARRSGITNMYLIHKYRANRTQCQACLGIDEMPPILSKFTILQMMHISGHKTEKTFKKYIKLSSDESEA